MFTINILQIDIRTTLRNYICSLLKKHVWRQQRASGSPDMLGMGREFTTPLTSVINVVVTSCVKCLPCGPSSIESSIFHDIQIIRSQTPPMWEECSGLKVQIIPEFFRYSATSPFRIFAFRASVAPTKKVPMSNLILSYFL